jgi:hypothetical protein
MYHTTPSDFAFDPYSKEAEKAYYPSSSSEDFSDSDEADYSEFLGRKKIQPYYGDPRFKWLQFWRSHLYSAKMNKTFVGMLSSTFLYVAVECQQAILESLIYGAVNWSVERKYTNAISLKNPHFGVAADHAMFVMESLSPKFLWDYYYHTTCITDSYIVCYVEDKGMDQNEFPLLKKQQNPRVESQILELRHVLKIKMSPDARFVFGEVESKLSLTTVSDEAFWHQATGRMIPTPDGGGLAFRRITIKPAHIQELNIPGVLLTEEQGRNLRTVVVGAIRGSSVDSGLGERLRNDSRILPDTQGFIGQVVERQWNSTVYRESSLALN